MKITALSLCCCFIILCSYGQSQCDSLFLKNIGSLIRGASLLNDSTIVAVGGNAYVTKSTNGGKSWRNIPINYNGTVLLAIQFTSDSIGYAVGDGGLIKTTDQGENWFTLIRTTNAYDSGYNAMFFFNKDTGFLVGANGHLLKTYDGGVSFKDTILSYFTTFSTISFVNDTTGLIGGDGVIMKTIDAGKTWQNIDISSLGFNPIISKIKYTSPTIAIGINNSDLIRSTDGGDTWAKFGNSTYNFLYGDFFFYDKDTGIFVGPQAGILTTIDGGVSLTSNYNLNTVGLTQLYCIVTSPSKKVVLAAGGGYLGYISGLNGRQFFLSNDKGATWKIASNNPTIDYDALAVINDSTVIVGGEDGYLFKSVDYGESWRQLQSVKGLYNYSISSISFIDSLHGFAATDEFFATSDGGKTWVVRSYPYTPNGGTVTKLQFFDSLHGFAFMGNAGLFKTVDGGASWVWVAQTQVSSFFTDFTFTKDGKGFIVGYNGEVQISSDSGYTWHVYNLNTTSYLIGVYFYDNLHGFIGASDSTVFITVDGGNTWTEKTGLGFLGQLKTYFAFSDSLNGFMVVNSGQQSITYIYKTTDGGNKWSLVSTQFPTLNQISGKNIIYAVGEYGTIMKTDHLYKPSEPGYIAGSVDECALQTGGYSVIQDNNIIYTWALSGGGRQRINGSTDTIKWNGSSGKYVLTVTANNTCGTSPARTNTIDVTYFKPVIAVNDTVLSVTKGSYYQWYRNDTLIKSGANDSISSLIVHGTGFYYAIVEGTYGCSGTTDTIQWPQILPLSLVQFTAQLAGENVTLQWQTANEINEAEFVVEKSTDGHTFTNIANVVAKNDINNSYNAVDNNLTAGKVFYRLKIINKDGSFTYSGIVSVRSIGSTLLQITPNPANSIAYITSKGEKMLSVHIYNNLGMLVYSINTNPVNAISINTGAFPIGTFFAVIQTNNTIYNRKIIVVR